MQGYFLIDTALLLAYDTHDMKRHHYLLTLLLSALVCCAVPAASAQDSAYTPSAKKAQNAKKDKPGAKKDKPGAKAAKGKKTPGAVGQYLGEVDEGMLWANSPAATDADFYIYLTTASWCGPCNAEMPHVVEHYKKMRELGNVELIVVSGDREAGAAKGFLEKYGAEFAAYDRNVGRRLPGYTSPNGIPAAIVVDKEGNVIKEGHGAIVNDWESLTVNNPEYADKLNGKNKGKKDAKDSKDANAVAAALKKLSPFNGKPNAKADYYIYLQSASWCGPCNNEMPGVVEAYKEMKKSGRVELVLVSHDKTEGDAKGFLKQYKAKFPAVMVQDKDIDKLPGFSKPNGIPNAIFVDKTGKVLTQGHGSLIQSWKEYTIERGGASAE